jgi:hypothetical protein
MASPPKHLPTDILLGLTPSPDFVDLQTANFFCDGKMETSPNKSYNHSNQHYTHLEDPIQDWQQG